MKIIYFIACLLTLVFTEIRAETPQEAIETLSAEGQQWVNRSCLRSLGPSLWSSCVRREVAALRAGVPDISKLHPQDQSWILTSCTPLLGPSLTTSCIRREKAAIEAGIPNLSHLTQKERSWIDQACSRSLGPSLYRICVNRESAALVDSSPLPSLALPSLAPSDDFTDRQYRPPYLESPSRSFSYPKDSIGHNTITFINRSGEPALVKLRGSTNTETFVPNGSSATVNAFGGVHYILTRYGASPPYSYSKGENFSVNESSTQYSEISITLHRVINGNYESNSISEAEFDGR